MPERLAYGKGKLACIWVSAIKFFLSSVPLHCLVLVDRCEAAYRNRV